MHLAAASVMEIGTKLQRARIDRAMTLRQISDVTKISPSVLELIERDDFSRMPGGIFTRAYLRAYAAHVGLDPEEIVNEFRAQFESPPGEEPLRLRSGYQDTSAGTLRLASVLVLGSALTIYIAFVSRSAETLSDAPTVSVDAYRRWARPTHPKTSDLVPRHLPGWAGGKGCRSSFYPVTCAGYPRRQMAGLSSTG